MKAVVPRPACRSAAAGHRGVRQARQPQGLPQEEVSPANGEGGGRTFSQKQSNGSPNY